MDPIIEGLVKFQIRTMRGTVLKLKSKRLCYTEDDDSDSPVDGGSSKSDASYLESNTLQTYQQSKETQSSFQDSQKKSWMSSLDLKHIPSTLHSLSRKSNFVINDPSSSCYQPVFYWNGPSMWKAMAKHPLFPQYMELQAKLIETFQIIQSDCRNGACEKALSALYMEKSSKAPESATQVSDNFSDQYMSEDMVKPTPAPPAFMKEDLQTQPRATERAIHSVLRIRRRSSPSHPLITKWRCSKCSRGFTRSLWFKKHQAMCHATMPTQPQCNNCLRVFSRRKWLAKHEALCSPSKNIECSSISPGMVSSKFHHEVEDQCSGPTKDKGRDFFKVSSKKECSENIDTSQTNSVYSKSHIIPIVLSEDYSVTEEALAASKTAEKSAFHSKKDIKGSKRKKVLCVGCLKVFKTSKSFVRHGACSQRAFNPFGSNHQCEQCSLLFTSHNKLLKHQVFCCPDRNNKMIKFLKCLRCSKIFPDRKKTLKHKAVCCPNSETKSKVCSVCCTVILNEERMMAHKSQCVKS